jgi:hypothetical protein
MTDIIICQFKQKPLVLNISLPSDPQVAFMEGPFKRGLYELD